MGRRRPCHPSTHDLLHGRWCIERCHDGVRRGLHVRLERPHPDTDRRRRRDHLRLRRRRQARHRGHGRCSAEIDQLQLRPQRQPGGHDRLGDGHDDLDARWRRPADPGRGGRGDPRRRRTDDRSGRRRLRVGRPRCPRPDRRRRNGDHVRLRRPRHTDRSHCRRGDHQPARRPQRPGPARRRVRRHERPTGRLRLGSRSGRPPRRGRRPGLVLCDRSPRGRGRDDRSRGGGDRHVPVPPLR